MKTVMMNNRARIWTFIIYPDEASCDVIKAVEGLRVPSLLSPLHSPVSDSETELKRHYHCMLQFSGKKADNQVNDMLVNLRNSGVPCTRPEPVADKKALIRYFVHDGYDDKEQFSYSELVSLNGFKSDDVVDDDSYIEDIIRWCNTAGCYEWSQLVDYAFAFMPEWKSVLFSRKSYPIVLYLYSCKALERVSRYRNGRSENQESSLGEVQ